MDDALNWLRKNDPKADDLDDDMLEALANLAGIPLAGAASKPKDMKAAAVDDTLDWLRSNDVDLRNFPRGVNCLCFLRLEIE